jgi:GNAT superfamily N-acetyltransferase
MTTANSDHPRRIEPDDPALVDVLHLIRAGFAYMEGRIDPPSSMHRLTLPEVKEQARSGEVWAIGTPPCACVFLTPKQPALYIGKLTVAVAARGKGHARSLVALADQRARALGLGCLELQSRIELTENHAAFAALGFLVTGMTAHAGYDRPTSVTLQRRLDPDAAPS